MVRTIKFGWDHSTGANRELLNTLPGGNGAPHGAGNGASILVLLDYPFDVIQMISVRLGLEVTLSGNADIVGQPRSHVVNLIRKLHVSAVVELGCLASQTPLIRIVWS